MCLQTRCSAVLAAAALLLAGACSDGGSLVSVDAPTPIRQFLSRQDMGRLLGYDPLATVPAAGVVVFRASYAGSGACTVCGYAGGYGVAAGERVGWLAPLPAGGRGAFDVAAGDTVLFGEGLWSLLSARNADGYRALRQTLAGDADVPLPVLRRIAQSLGSDMFSADSTVAAALLANPVAGADRDVLLALADRYGFSVGGWYALQKEAWRRLAPLVAPLSRLRLEGRIAGSASLYPGLAVHNDGDVPTVVAGGMVCFPALRLFRDAGYTLQAWDSEHWWAGRTAGGCKLPAPLAVVPAGQQVILADGDIGPADILGDSLPAGTYYAAIPLRLSTPAGDTTVLARAGALTLSK